MFFCNLLDYSIGCVLHQILLPASNIIKTHTWLEFRMQEQVILVCLCHVVLWL